MLRTLIRLFPSSDHMSAESIMVQTDRFWLPRKLVTICNQTTVFHDWKLLELEEVTWWVPDQQQLTFTTLLVSLYTYTLACWNIPRRGSQTVSQRRSINTIDGAWCRHVMSSYEEKFRVDCFLWIKTCSGGKLDTKPRLMMYLCLFDIPTVINHWLIVISIAWIYFMPYLLFCFHLHMKDYPLASHYNVHREPPITNLW